jgi:hypothetical protein
LCGKATSQRRLVDVVDEGPHAVDLDDREPFAVAHLELRVALDVDLCELELHLLPDVQKHASGAVAEVAAWSVVEDDPRGYG